MQSYLKMSSREPDFNNMLKVLRREKPDRPTLFEYFLNRPLYERLAGEKHPPKDAPLGDVLRFLIKAFRNAGYDFVMTEGSHFWFPPKPKNTQNSFSLNDNATITDRESFDAYDWRNPDDFDYSHIKDAKNDLPSGMKILLRGPGGVFADVMALTGYDNLCYMIYEDPQLVHDLFERIGTGILRYYRNSICSDSVGMLMSNDDWGFNTQPMLSPEQMREFVFPWHRRVAELGHELGLPVVLHSCGNLDSIMDEIIDDLKYDGKHSYEDNIIAVEDAYKKWGNRIAILGGIDINFMVSKSPEEIRARCKEMLKLGTTGYALGTGNSVPDYIPDENYFAMIETVLN